MNFPNVVLPLLEVENHQLKPVFRCILHTILYNRLLGTLRPKATQSEIFDDIFYMTPSNSNFLRLVEAEIEKCYGAFLEAKDDEFDMHLTFYENKETVGLFTTVTKKVFWERWQIRLRRTKKINDPARIQQHSQLSKDLKKTLATILDRMDELKDHLPPFRKANQNEKMPCVSYPFQITLPQRSENWGSSLRRMFDHAPPLLTSPT